MAFTQNPDIGRTELAIEKGLNYLSSQNVNGCWKGFPTLAGESTIWVTGFVLAHIRNLCKEPELIRKAESFLLLSGQQNGGWSYSSQVPPDADSTSWCLQALQPCKEFSAVDSASAKTFLWNHFTGNGIATYKSNSGIREFIGAPADEWIAGWTSPHTDVSVAAILADPESEKVANVINWLMTQQTDRGFLNAYWWRGPYYATAQFLRSLAKVNHPLPAKLAERVLSSLMENQLEGGGFGLDSSLTMDSFSTALALQIFTNVTTAGSHSERSLCGNALLQAQQNDGSWKGDFILRIPAPPITNPDEVLSWSNADGGGNSLIEDRGGLFATAMSCYALDCWLKKETSNKEM